MNWRTIFSRTASPFQDANREAAARLMLTPTALTDLTEADARTVVKFMQLKRVAAGTVIIKEGEGVHTDFMMLILEGDVSVENEAASMEDSMVMSIIGPGALIGEMGLLDGAPRSATCAAITELAVGVLSRDALLRLIHGDSAVAARLLLAISKRLSDRLRDANRKIRTLGSLGRTLQQELDAAHKTGSRAQR